MPLIDELKLRRRLQVTADLVFETAWRIGTGKEGITSSDLGVMLDPVGKPVLPGSSLKGKLRSTCEGLAHALNMTACFLNVQASGIKCVSDTEYYRDVKDEHKKAIRDEGPEQLLAWINAHTCDVCKLFGCVCPVNSVLDEHGVMPSERRAYPCPKVNRAIRAKSSSGAAGSASGNTVV